MSNDIMQLRNKMKVYPDSLVIDDKGGFSIENDMFGKARLAQGMSNLVSSVDDPLVIAFDGIWGSGKTTFLKMWAADLRNAGHPVIFFDAFENDYVEDAFAALARELVELAEKNSLPTERVFRDIKEKAIDLGALLIRGAAKVGVKAAVRAATVGTLTAAEAKEVLDDLTSEVGEAAEAYMQQLIERPRQQKETVKRFRKSLEELPTLIAKAEDGEKQKPLIFIIDELDRCKPLFALALLERIKHFMSVPNVHFILGTHLRQLEASVRYAYGSEIDATTYLQKFINLTIVNADTFDENRVQALDRYADYLKSQLRLPDDRNNSLDATITTMVRVARIHNMSFRSLERAFTVLALSKAFTPKNYLQLAPFVAGLIMMKLIAPDLFLKAKKSTLTLPEAVKFLRFQPDPEREANMSWEENWWTYALADELPEHLNDFGRSIRFEYNFRDRRDVLRYTANDVVDRLSPP